MRPPTGLLTEGHFKGSGYCDPCQAVGDPREGQAWLDTHVETEAHKWRVRS